MNHALKASSLFIILILNTSAWALEGRKTPHDQHQEWVEQIGKEYWRPFEQKLKQMNDSFKVDPTKNDYIYLGPSGDCSNKSKGGDLKQVARTHYNITKSQNKFKLVVKYWDCSGEEAFSEILNIEGDKITEANSVDVLLGKREFQLQEGEDIREHSILNINGQRISHLRSERKNNGIHSQLVVGETLTHQLYYEIDSQRNFYNVFDFNLDLLLKTQYYRTITQGNSAQLYIENQTRGQRIYYRSSPNDEFQEVSPKTQTEFISDGALSQVRHSIKGWIGIYIDHLFPASEIHNGGGAGDRLKDELFEILQFIVSNTQHERVIQYIQHLIQSVKDGKVEDNRPEKK